MRDVYNGAVSSERHQPDLDRLSTLAALVLLVYALVRVLSLPTVSVDLTGLGVIIPLAINTRLVMLLLAAALSIIAADWLTQDHPRSEPGSKRFEAWILPGLAALAIGGLVTSLPQGATLWLGLLLAAAALMTVLVAEYLVMDPEDPRYRWAARGLEALAYLLLAEMFFTLRAANVRAVFLIPSTLVATSAVSWRLLRLWQPNFRSLLSASLIGWVLTQTAWALHYWPLQPAQESLLLVVLFYSTNGLLGWQVRGELDVNRVAEYTAVALISGGLIVFLI